MTTAGRPSPRSPVSGKTFTVTQSDAEKVSTGTIVEVLTWVRDNHS